MFVIARNQYGIAVGCGAFRPIDDNIAEVKRMYTKIRASGIGIKLLHYLEVEAHKMGYSIIWLETRLVNKQAVFFYEKNGYTRIPNYGKYIDNNKAVYFQKHIL